MSCSSELLLPPASTGSLPDGTGHSMTYGGNVVSIFSSAPHRWAAGRRSRAGALPRASYADAYRLVLLVDQELRRNRQDRARSLIEAAYAAYDQCGFGS